jgi:hypothetical protein
MTAVRPLGREVAAARASEMHPHPDPEATRVCEGCGCTEDDACLDRATGLPCSWVDHFDGDLCSLCAKILAVFVRVVL